MKGRGPRLIAVAIIALLALAGRAAAAELVYWNNYGVSNDTVGYANADGTGGKSLNLVGADLEGPEGMAIDTATGRILIASFLNDKILYVNLDGKHGGGELNTAGAVVDEPTGLALDPVSRVVYWANREGVGAEKGSIGFARLDGSGGGTLDTAGATVYEPFRVAIDSEGRKVYWGNSGIPAKLSYASLDGSGGGDLDLTGTSPVGGFNGFAVDETARRIYWVGAFGFSYASLEGGGGADIAVSSELFDSPYGLAFDPSQTKLIWTNSGNGTEREDALAELPLGGVAKGIDIATGPVEYPQDPQILRSPTATTAPSLTRSNDDRTELSCATPSWAGDYAGGFIWQAPTTMSIKWLRDGTLLRFPLNRAIYEVRQPGAYACAVTGTNRAGSATVTSEAIQVTAAKLKAIAKTKKRRMKPGRRAIFRFQLLNQGDITAHSVVCIVVPKRVRRYVLPQKCKGAGLIAGRSRVNVKFRVHARRTTPPGAYKLKLVARGAPAKPAFARLQVLP